MSREDLHFRLRIPAQLKEKVEKAAVRNHRSMTAEIISRLEKSFQHATIEVPNSVLLRSHAASRKSGRTPREELMARLDESFVPTTLLDDDARAGFEELREAQREMRQAMRQLNATAHDLNERMREFIGIPVKVEKKNDGE